MGTDVSQLTMTSFLPSSPPSSSSSPSLPLRERLCKEFVVVPDVLTSLSIDVYFRHALDLVTYGQAAMLHQELARAYVHKKKLALYVMEALPKHPSYNLPSNAAAKTALCRAAKAAVDDLERIVQAMDAQELRAREEATHLALIDAFDSDQHDTGAAARPLPTAAVAAAAVVLDRGPTVPRPSANLDVLRWPPHPQLADGFSAETGGPRSSSSPLYTVPEYMTPLAQALEPPPSVVMVERQRDEADILRCLVAGGGGCGFTSFNVPAPHTSTMVLALGPLSLRLVREDFQVSFAPFMRVSHRICR